MAEVVRPIFNKTRFERWEIENEGRQAGHIEQLASGQYSVDLVLYVKSDDPMVNVKMSWEFRADNSELAKTLVRDAITNYRETLHTVARTGRLNTSLFAHLGAGDGGNES